MIEFKADCGHVIQAPDQDAGKIVKCAYCGREVEAPLRDQEDPDLLFQEVDLNELAKSESMAGMPGAMTIQGHQKRAKSVPSAEDIAQTGSRVLRISLVAAFATICLVVLVFGISSIRNMASPELASSDRFGPSAPRGAPPRTPLPDPPAESVDTPSTSVGASAPNEPIARGSGGRVGYSFTSTSQGVFVEVFNKAARIYVRDRESTNQEILGADQSEREGSGTLEIRLPPGQYRIGVILPADDDQLTSLNGFDAIRSDLESENEDAALAEFFARDASSETAFIDDSGFRQSVVRYYDIVVQPHEWALVTSLFTPRGPIRTMLSYIPNEAKYSFDEEAAREELDARGIATVQVSSMIDMLARAGQMVLPATHRGDGEFDIFEIDVRDGAVRTRELRLPDRADQPVVATPDDPGVPPQLRPKSPWNRRSGSRLIPAADLDKAESSLQTVLNQLREKRAKNENIHADDVRPYIAGGAQYALWQNAEARTRMEFAELLEADAAASLVQELGETMLNDPDLDVRLALLASLVRSADTEAIKAIGQRLDAIEDDDTLDREEADREGKELRQALSDLSPPKGKGPWGRRG